MAVEAINLKKGMIFEQGGKLIKVLESNHHKPGKGNTVMQMKLTDVRTGAIVQTTMRPSEKVDLVMVDKKLPNTSTVKVSWKFSWIWKLTNNMS